MSTDSITPNQPKSNKMTTLSIIVVIAVIATGIIAFEGKKDSTTQANNNITTPSTTSTDNNPSATANTYADGTYSVTGEYTSPMGPESIEVQLTLENGVITESTVVPQSEKDPSKKFQEAFESGYQAMIIGKSIDEVNLDKVSGSSLTPKGFNDAIEKIKAQAKA